MFFEKIRNGMCNLIAIIFAEDRSIHRDELVIYVQCYYP